MTDDSLLEAMPDVVAFIQPNGLITHHLGGRRLPFMQGAGTLAGRQLEDVLPTQIAGLVSRLVRRALVDRATCEAEFTLDGATYQVRLSAQGPRRALCVIRQAAAVGAGKADTTTEAPKVAERRGFMRRYRRSLADAALRERPLALCVIVLDGLSDIGRLIDFSIRERILSEILAQLPGSGDESADSSWYVGHLGESLLGAVIEGHRDHDSIRTIGASICEVIARPVRVHDATFHLTPYAGVAVLGEDASRSAALLDHARAAMLEAQRSAAGTVQFYSDTLRMLPVARLDIERELRLAIEEDQIGMRYVARHDLATGRVAGIHAYMRWSHPLQDDIPPSKFLPIANATGLAPALSRVALMRLLRDLPGLRARFGPEVTVSFGALRQHVTSGQLLNDLRELASASGCDIAGIEFRIAERTLAHWNRPEQTIGEMAQIGLRLIIDEVGRDFSSVSQLARLPISGLQIDRALVTSAPEDAVSRRACRAVAAIADALDMIAIAPGVDDETLRRCMGEAGCTQGLGDFYPRVTDTWSVAGVAGASAAGAAGAAAGTTRSGVTAARASGPTATAGGAGKPVVPTRRTAQR